MVDTINKGKADGLFDHALMFISTGNLTKGKTTTTAFKIRGTPPLNGLSVRMLFPRFPGTTCKILPVVAVSTDNSTFRVQSTYPGGALSAVAGTSGAKEIQFDFEIPSGFPYVRMQFTYTGGTTGSSFGAAIAGIVPRGQGEWNRNVRFS
jgi:hypothetical protein